MRNKIIVFALLIAFTATVWIMPNIAEAGTTVNVSSVSALQSAHPYSDQMDKTWVYTHSVMADKLEITFSTDTQTESGYDYIYIYDGTGNQVGKYDGTNLAGKTITVSGSSVKIRLTSDSSQTKYGFRVTQIIAKNETGPITNFANTGVTRTSLSFSFPEPKEATSVVLEYSTDGDIWNVAPTGDLTADSTSATVGDLEFGKKYWFRLNVVGGTREGISNVLELIMGYSTEADFSFSNGTITKYNGISPFVLIPETIGGVAVTKVGNGAFSGCTSMTSITIPDSVTSIGDSAFRGCTSLEEITLPFVGAKRGITGTVDSVFGYIFGYSTSSQSGTTCQYYSNYESKYYYIPSTLKKVTITDETIIPYGAFYNCSNLISITIPDSVTSIGEYAFYYCTSLTTITIPESVTSIGDCAFKYCTSLTSITIPESVTSIGEDAFEGCTSLTSITIPDYVTSIGSGAFYGCNNLKDVYISDIDAWCGIDFIDTTSSNPLCNGANLYLDGNLVTELEIPDTVTEIGSYVFYNCTSLESITIPESVTSIGEDAFYGCTSLTLITIPESVTSIGEGAFSGCTSLTSITIPESVTSIRYRAFSSCTSLTSITIPDSVTSIGQYAFGNCTSLTTITIPDSVTSIGYGAFGNCTSLTTITIPESVTSIWDEAFSYCTSLTTIIIPDSVTRIGSGAFSNCTSLTTITIPESVTSIGYRAFYNCTSIEKINYNAKKLTSSLSSSSNVFYNAGKDGTGIDVVFGDSVEEIPSYLFYVNDSSYAPKIKTVTMGCNVTSIGEYAFSDCTSLTTITILDSVTSIGNYAFSDCTSLTTITIPESVTSIGYRAFYNCTSLKKINYNAKKLTSSLSSSGDVFCNAGKDGAGIDVVFGDSVEEIPDCLFYVDTSSYAPKIKTVTMGCNVTSIGYWAFYNCTSLEKINYNAKKLTSSLSSLDDVFYNAGKDGTGIDVVFGDSVEEIPDYLFYVDTSSYAPKIKTVTMGCNVTSIGSSAFSGCTSLESITVPNSVTSIGKAAFGGCTSLEEITLPFVGAKRGISGTVDSVFGYIFGYTTSSESGTTRQYYSDYETAYYYIPSTLKKVTITDETVVPYGAFYGCVNLTDVIIDGNPTAIMAKAFMGHENLWNITIKSKNVRYANGRMFEITDMPTIYGYEGSTTETYAKNYDLWFVALSEEEEEGYALNADAVLVNGKIVIDITTDKPVTDQALHVALYNDASKLVDYIIVPLNKAYNSFNVVFRDETNSSFAKVFLWDGLESMTPIAQAKTVTIKNK